MYSYRNGNLIKVIIYLHLGIIYSHRVCCCYIFIVDPNTYVYNICLRIHEFNSNIVTIEGAEYYSLKIIYG